MLNLFRRFFDIDMGPTATVGGIHEAIGEILDGAQVAIESCPKRPVQVKGWWLRLWLTLRGAQTWEMRRVPGTMRVIIVYGNEPSPDDKSAIQEVINEIRPAGVLLVEVEYLENLWVPPVRAQVKKLEAELEKWKAAVAAMIPHCIEDEGGILVADGCSMCPQDNVSPAIVRGLCQQHAADELDRLWRQLYD
jgi:hypothetical protein